MKTHKGFSLIELAIVLVIIGFLMGFLFPISAKKDQQNLKSTQKTLEEIKDALLGFAVQPLYYDDEYEYEDFPVSPLLSWPSRIPCPAKYGEYDLDHPENDNFVGREDLTLCGKEGFLPWKVLKVGRYDVWGNPFRYRVALAFSTTGRTVGISPTNISGNLKVKNKQGDINWTVTSGYPVVAIIFSDGKNQTPDDENKSKNTTYVHDGYVYIDKMPIDHPDNFDDILTWLSRNTLMDRLTTAKRWPPEP